MFLMEEGNHIHEDMTTTYSFDKLKSGEERAKERDKTGSINPNSEATSERKTDTFFNFISFKETLWRVEKGKGI